MAHLHKTLGTYYRQPFQRKTAFSSVGQVPASKWELHVLELQFKRYRHTCEYWRLFRRVRKTAKSDCHVRPFIRPHITTQLAMDGLFMKFDEIFGKFGENPGFIEI
jgi:hypothetical protein